jgi:serine/threonine protein kinase
LDSFQHFDISPTERLPFTTVKDLGVGGQGSVDEIHHDLKGYKCARKRVWVDGTPQSKEKDIKRLSTETAILRKLCKDRHIIEILATYSQGAEFGMLYLPVAQCDLNVLLGQPTEKRRELISDLDLERGFGCLSAALQYMHEKGVRHKDIKPHNILVHGASLIFADFGLAKDFSVLGSSITNDQAVGTHSYYAPEVASNKPRGCGADVFSLGCVLLEIWSVLFGLAPVDQNGFSSLQPYYENLAGVQAWIEEKKSSLNTSALRAFWLQACQLMVAKAPRERPRMSNVLLRLKEEYEMQPGVFSKSLCKDCLEKSIINLTEADLDKLRNTDFIWSSDIDTLLDQDNPTVILPNSNRGLLRGKIIVDIFSFGDSLTR